MINTQLCSHDESPKLAGPIGVVRKVQIISAWGPSIRPSPRMMPMSCRVQRYCMRAKFSGSLRVRKYSAAESWCCSVQNTDDEQNRMVKRCVSGECSVFGVFALTDPISRPFVPLAVTIANARNIECLGRGSFHRSSKRGTSGFLQKHP